MVVLYTSFYEDKNPVRHKELEYCLQQNIENELIDKIYLMIEGEVEIPKSNKIITLESKRPTYRDFFDTVNRKVQSENEVSIICNSDIYFNHTLSQLNIHPRECIALSRWDHKPEGLRLHNERYSQDTWIFKGHIRNIRHCDFYLGIPGCDNRIAYELNRAGYRLSNPATKIQSIHYHQSDLHNYDDNTPKIAKPYLFINVT